jgi:hypothetical protein
MPALVLGGVVFKNFEIPEHIIFPIKQRYKIHYHLGSARVVDAMGPDPQPVRWEGRFTGPDASSRVRALQGMTSSGVEWHCVFGTFMEQGLITDFTPVMEKPWDYRYAIEFLPTTNQGSGSGGASFSPLNTTGFVVGQDLTTAQGGAAAAQAIQDSTALQLITSGLG